jgi:hypothetical protein
MLFDTTLHIGTVLYDVGGYVVYIRVGNELTRGLPELVQHFRL